MIRPTLILIGLMAATTLFIILGEQSPEMLFKSKTATISTPKVSVFMHNTKTDQFGLDGQLRYHLTTEKSVHYDKTGQSDLFQPKLIAFQSNQLPWHLTANKGVIINNGEKIILSDRVYAWQTLVTGGKNTLKTSEFTYYPEKNAPKPVNQLH